MSIDPSILLAGRIFGTLLFAVAVLSKLRHRDEFTGVIANYRLVPEAAATPVAWLIIVLEAFTALSLGSGIALVAGAACAVLLLWLFAVAMTINLVRGRKHIDCGCFQSALRQHLSVARVVRNLVLIAWLLPLAMEENTRALSSLQVLNGIGAGLMVFVLYQAFDQLSALRDSAAALRARFS